ncbi:mediator of RNA polymerase II transcription subunit 10 [Anomaloglossus baeobatrachus]|uniref:mediator of RNA polymerase II transcription subunit 10 n=1 Tax=Anomaloglossus baeobatrachus TaxID=238106 RepID=UPI003F4FBCDB
MASGQDEEKKEMTQNRDNYVYNVPECKCLFVILILTEVPVWNFMITGLQDIDKCRQQLHDITVPLEVFDYIDQGRNPQLYTKECLERALAKNEQVKGKIDTMKKFKSLLIQELSKVFPEDMAKYKAIRGEEHPPS